MHFRLLLSSALLIAPALAAGAQTERWNERTSERWKEDAPAITVWFDESRQLRFGSSPRVRFRVEEDAYVMVGRVDSDGRMTILFPYENPRRCTGETRGGEAYRKCTGGDASRTRSFVEGGTDNLVRSRRGGSMYSFTAYERFGIGFVFAIASYEPLDFSRFQSRDFESYEGVANAISRRYIGNSQRIVEKIAPWILWDQGTPYEYDIVSYAVEGPMYSSYSTFCGSGSLGYGGYGGYGNYGGMYDPSYCRSARGYYGFFCSNLFGYASALCYDPYFGRFGNGGGIIATGPQQPPTLPATPDKVPNTKLIPQIAPPGDDGKINRGLRAIDLPTRPTVGGSTGEDELDRVYSIPRRALDDMRRQERIERRPIGEIVVGAGGAEPTDRTPGNRVDGRPTSEGRPASGERRERGEERPGGSPGRQDWARDRENPTTRGDNVSTSPPPRESPRNYDPPARGGDREDNGGGRLGGSGRSSEPPPRSFDPPSRSEPRHDPGPRSAGGIGGGDGVRSAPPAAQPSAPPPQSPAVREAAVEKKPEKP